MFLDASAIVAVLARERDAEVLAVRLSQASKINVSPLVFYEATLGLARATDISIADANEKIGAFLATLSAESVPITAERGAKAIAAFERYGKGRHPAGLNMGDCFAYACAQDLEVPLLFKGDDFSKTDVLMP